MGHHYVPQQYLRNFSPSDKPGFIWQFVKPNGDPALLPIKQVAQTRAFYDDEVEKLLGREVESPGNHVINLLIHGERLSENERVIMGIYLGVMLNRVPTTRKRVGELLPGALDIAMGNFRAAVAEAAKQQASPDDVARWLSDADRLEIQYKADPPQSVKDQIREPWPSPAVVNAILTMSWQILTNEGSQCFVTSDNPFFFTRGPGLANPASEFFLPLSPTCVLHGDRRKMDKGVSRCRLPQRVVRLINKRTIIEADKMVFSHAKSSWLPSALAIKDHGDFIPTWECLKDNAS